MFFPSFFFDNDVQETPPDIVSDIMNRPTSKEELVAQQKEDKLAVTDVSDNSNGDRSSNSETTGKDINNNNNKQENSLNTLNIPNNNSNSANIVNSDNPSATKPTAPDTAQDPLDDGEVDQPAEENSQESYKERLRKFLKRFWGKVKFCMIPIVSSPNRYEKIIKTKGNSDSYEEEEEGSWEGRRGLGGRRRGAAGASYLSYHAFLKFAITATML